MPNQVLKELRKTIDSNDPFITSGHQVIDPNSQFKKGSFDKKEIPKWVRDDKKIQEVLLRAFPKLLTDTRQRARAARWIRIIHLYFRMLMTRGQVAIEMNISPSAVHDAVKGIRRVASGRRYDGRGKLGQKPRGRPKSHPLSNT